MLRIRSGIGYDIHRIKSGNGLYIGGILVSDNLEFIAHSDGDVLLHSITDSLLGAVGEDDIGVKFPDTDPQYKNMKSDFFLKKTADILKERNIEIMNIDSVLLAEIPKISPFRSQIIENIASILEISPENVNIKAKTKEKTDSVGKGESIECFSVCMVRYL